MRKYIHSIMTSCLKHITLAICLSVVSIFIPQMSVYAQTSVWTGSTTSLSVGTGTANDPYLISTADEFAHLMQNYDNNLGIYRNRHFKLMADLEMEGFYWSFASANSNQKTFCCHFDGNGHKISNIKGILVISNQDIHLGLFPQLGGSEDFEAVIENLEIDNISFEYTAALQDYNWSKIALGGLVGQQYSYSRIENCIVSNLHLESNGEISKETVPNWKVKPLVGETMSQYGKSSSKANKSKLINSYGNAILGGKQVVQGNAPKQNADNQGKYTWHKRSNGCYSFNAIKAEVVNLGGVTPFQYEVRHNKLNGEAYTYEWKLNELPINETSAIVTAVPNDRQQILSVAVHNAIGATIATDAIVINPVAVELHVKKITPIGRSYTIETEMRNSNGDKVSEYEYAFSWQDLDENMREVGTGSTLNGALRNHTYVLKARHRRINDLVISLVQTFHQPIYVCHDGINASEASRYTTDGKSYAPGNDANDGKTPETAVRTLKRAYELLSSENQGGSTASNVIMIMGKYNENAFASTLNQGENPNNFDKNKPAMLIGNMGNLKNGCLMMYGEDIRLGANTHFESITLCGNSNSRNADETMCKIFACGHDLTFGYGVNMEGYRQLDLNRGSIEGTMAPHFSVYGGLLDNDDQNIPAIKNTLTFLSGHYGRIIAGGSFNGNMKQTGNINGSAQKPQQTHLVIDIANNRSKQQYTYDALMVIGGQVDGSLYANSTIDIYGTTTIGRLVGGSNGYSRQGVFMDDLGNKSFGPSDSFYGQSTINMYGGLVNTIYGTGLGRTGSNTNQRLDSCTQYFYGKVNINLMGGTVKSNIYGAGAAVTSGLGNSFDHTYDPYIPYLLDEKTILYGSFEQANGKLPQVAISGDSAIDLSKTEVHINISGKVNLLGTVHGGGDAFSSAVSTHEALCQSGDLFGNTYIDMQDGIVEGYIFGGGKGNLSYFDNSDGTGFRSGIAAKAGKRYFNKCAQVIGDTHININGGTVHGSIFGGGEGCYYRATSESDPINLAAEIGDIKGSTYVTIGQNAVLHDYLFGAGNYGNIRVNHNPNDTTSGSTHITIYGGRFGNSIFGGGHGHHEAKDPRMSVYSMIDRNCYIKVLDGQFEYVADGSRYLDQRYYGVYGGGMTTSIVKGNTYLDLQHSLFTNEFLENANFKAWNSAKGWDHRFAYCGGGFGESTDVKGDTHVTVNVKGAPAITQTIFDEEELSAAHAGILFMDLYGGGLSGNVQGSTYVDVYGNVIVRNVFGGGMLGNVGTLDDALNGDPYTINNQKRNYQTGTHVNIHSGYINRVFGGAQMGNVGGETFVKIGSLDTPKDNEQIHIDMLYGGNDLTGTIAGNNNSYYGTHINIYGGHTNTVYGSGNGQSHFYDRPDPNHNDTRNKLVGKARPHVAASYINVQGISHENMAHIDQFLYGGGNNTTVGCFELAENNRPEYGQLREILIPNSGSISINLGSHVSIANLVMGNNGRRLLDFAPQYTTDGKNWIRGFENDVDFERFCRTVDVSCVPVLTFNANGTFANAHAIDDRMNQQVIFDTHGEMDATDIEINTFVGGSYSGSMTGDSLYQYTLPTGVTIGDKIVGGCMNSILTYTEQRGDQKGTKRTFIGGMRPYRKLDEARNEQRIQLNVFCNFTGMMPKLDGIGRKSHRGAQIYGGCLEKGVIVGVSVVNLHSNLLGNYSLYEGETLSDVVNTWTSTAGQIFGGGKGELTENIGNTYVNLKGAVFNGQKCLPNVIHAFGGGQEGNVVGRANVYCDFQCPIATPTDAQTNSVWGGIYGGGLSGSVRQKSSYFPELGCPDHTGSHVRVWSGTVNNIFGGSRNGDIEGATYVDIDDRGENHYHTIVNTVFGGNDVSGSIGTGTIGRRDGADPLTTNTYVRVREHKKNSDGGFNGFPLIGELFGGGNGYYGEHASDRKTYKSGRLEVLNGHTIDLAGMTKPDVDSAYVEIEGGTIWHIYGGAQNAHVGTKSVIDIHYTDETRNAICCFDGRKSFECYKYGQHCISAIAVDGGYTDSDQRIYANHNIKSVYGGNKQSGLWIQPEFHLSNVHIGSLYGGNNMGNVYTDEAENEEHNGLTLILDDEKLEIDNVFGGSRMGNVRGNSTYGTNIVVRAGKYGRIFGGNDISGNIDNGTHILLEGGIINEVYGAGNGEYIYKYDSGAENLSADYDTQLGQYVCHIPATEQYGGKDATPFQKLQAINATRPNISRAYIEVRGGRKDNSRNMVYISKAIYAGGNCATIIGKEGSKNGDLTLDLGDYSVINSVYLGSNGERHINTQYLNALFAYNELDDLTVTDSEGRNLLDYHMDAVLMHGLPRDFQLKPHYDRCYIGSFYLGGARGSLAAHGNLAISFPRTLNIFNKIVGGSDRAKITYKTKGKTLTHEGGILWDGMDTRPEINISVQSQFLNREMSVKPEYEADLYLKQLTEEEGILVSGARVYGGCFLSGKVEGEVNIDLQVE